MCNSLCSSIVSGTTKLIKNTAFPALFVTVGHSSKFQRFLPSVSLTGLAETEFSFKPNAIGTYVQSQLNSTWVYITSTDIPGLGSSLWENVSQIGIRETFGTLYSIFENHKVAIGVAAGIGASATIIDALLKRAWVIRNTNPFLRLNFSVGLATAVTLAAATNRGHTVDPQTIMDIAIKIIVVGSMLKGATTASRVVLKTIRGSSDWLAWTVSGICTGFIGVTNAFDWGSLPTRLESGSKKTKHPERKSERNVSSPRKGEADLQKSQADLEDTEPPPSATPSKSRNSKRAKEPSEEKDVKAVTSPKKEKKEPVAGESKETPPAAAKKESADLEDTES